MLTLSRQARAPLTTGQQATLTRAATIRPHAVHNANGQAITTSLLAAGVAVSLVFGAPQPVLAANKSLAETRKEQEAALQEQLSMLEYKLQQQQNAAKAELLGKRQALENTVEQVDTAIQRKLIEEAANEQAAEKKGEEQRALRIEAEAERIKAQEQAIQVAAAKAEARLDAEAIVEKAREVEKQQQIQKAEGSIMELLGITQADLGL